MYDEHYLFYHVLMNRDTEFLVNCQQQAFKIYIKNNLLKYIMTFFFSHVCINNPLFVIARASTPKSALSL